MEEPTLYEVLSVAPDATPQEIRDAYVAKAKRQHPDNGGNSIAWNTIQDAYNTLIDADTRAEYDGASHEDEEDGSDCDDDESEEDDWSCELQPFDLFAALGLSCTDKGDICGGETRLRARFYLLAVRTRPRAAERYDDPSDYADAITRFRQVCLAFSVLRDAERRRIYDSGGFERLRAAEAYQAESVFDLDARDVSNAFFKGSDPEDRNFLLLNSNDAFDEEAYDERCERRRLAGADAEGSATGGDVAMDAAPGEWGEEEWGGEEVADKEEEEGEGEEEGETDDDDADDEDEVLLIADACGREGAARSIRDRDLLNRPPPAPPPVLAEPAPFVPAVPFAHGDERIEVAFDWERTHSALRSTQRESGAASASPGRGDRPHGTAPRAATDAEAEPRPKRARAAERRQQRTARSSAHVLAAAIRAGRTWPHTVHRAARHFWWRVLTTGWHSRRRVLLRHACLPPFSRRS